MVVVAVGGNGDATTSRSAAAAGAAPWAMKMRRDASRRGEQARSPRPLPPQRFLICCVIVTVGACLCTVAAQFSRGQAAVGRSPPVKEMRPIVFTPSRIANATEKSSRRRHAFGCHAVGKGDQVRCDTDLQRQKGDQIDQMLQGQLRTSANTPGSGRGAGS